MSNDQNPDQPEVLLEKCLQINAVEMFEILCLAKLGMAMMGTTHRKNDGIIDVFWKHPLVQEVRERRIKSKEQLPNKFFGYD